MLTFIRVGGAWTLMSGHWVVRRVNLPVLCFLFWGLACISVFGQNPPPAVDQPQQISVRNSAIHGGRKRECVCFEGRDQVWRISARSSGCCRSKLEGLRVFELVDGRWTPRTLEDFVLVHQTDKTRKTLFYFHGNRTDAEWAISRGSQMYRELFYRSDRDTPLRFVIWQWRSEPELKRPLVDFEVKSRRAVSLGPVVAKVLTKLGDRDLLLMGYSLGAQVVLSALYSPELSLPETPETYDLVLIAPVFDCHFSSCGCVSVPDSRPVGRGFVFKNRSDRVVQLAARNCCRQCGIRDGSVGTLVNRKGPLFLKLSELDVGAEIANRHSVVNYSSSCTIKDTVNSLLLSE